MINPRIRSEAAGPEGPADSGDGIDRAAQGAFADYLTGRRAERLPVEQVVRWNRWGATRERA